LIQAIALVPDGPLDVYLSQCIAHCAHRGYVFAGLARDWPAALDMLKAHLASVVVFARQEHLDPQREPRVEVCGETTQALFRRHPGPHPEPGRRGRLV
jgi:hypothetical protein